MKRNLLFSLIFLLLIGCKSQIPKDINSYVIKISETGITDISRETLVVFADSSYKDKKLILLIFLTRFIF